MIEKNIRLQPHHARDLLVGRRSDGRRPKYQPPGGGATSLGSGRDVGGGGGHGGGHDRGGQQHAAQAAAAQAAARNRAAAEAAAQKVAAERAMQATIAQAEAERQEVERMNQLAEARKLMTQPVTVDVPHKDKPLTPVPYKIDPYQQSFIEPGSVTTTDFYREGDYDKLVEAPVDVGFQEALRKQQIATDLREKQQDLAYGQFFRPQPVVEKPSGIMGTVKDKATQMVKNIAQQKTMKALGLARLNPYLGVGNWLLDKFAPGAKAKFTRKFNFPGTDTKKEATKKLVSGDTRDGDGIQQAVTGENVVTESMKQFTGTTDEQAEFMKRRNIVQGILDQGSYQGKELTGEDRNNLLNYIEQISKFIVDPMEVAYGGRIDKALGGRSRYL